jgi:hypothetical protein
MHGRTGLEGDGQMGAGAWGSAAKQGRWSEVVAEGDAGWWNRPLATAGIGTRCRGREDEGGAGCRTSVSPEVFTLGATTVLGLGSGRDRRGDGARTGAGRGAQAGQAGARGVDAFVVLLIK